MKRIETIKSKITKERLFAVVMVLCFLYSGFSILSFTFEAYSAFTAPESSFKLSDLNFSIDRQVPDSNLFDSNLVRDSMRQRIQRDRFEFIYAPLSISYLFGGIVSLLAGIAILNLLREKEHKQIKSKTAGAFLLPDERKVVEVLKNYDSKLAQSKIVRETGLSKVQVHRAVKKLEARGLIEKHQYGLTNKIILKKGFFE